MAISSIVGLSLSEIIVRTFYPQPYSSFFPNSSEQWPKGDNEWLKGAFPKKKIGFEMIPSLAGINKYGLFDKDREIKRNNNTFRIIVLGDSVTTHGSPPYPHVLEAILNRNNHRYSFEVWNLGFPTYNTLLEKEYLQIKGLKFNPDMVIIGFCLNDFGTGSVALKNDGRTILYQTQDDAWLEINPFLFTHSHLYRLVVNSIITYKTETEIKKIEDSNETKRDYKYLSPRHWNVVYYSLIEIKEMVSLKDIPLLLVVIPYLKDFSKYSSYEKDTYNAIFDIAKKLNISYINMNTYFVKEGDWEQFRYKDRPWDFMHTNNRGHQLIGETIYAYLVQEQLIK